MPPFVCLHFSNHAQLELKDYPSKPAGFVVVNSGCLKWRQDQQHQKLIPGQFTFLSQDALSGAVDDDCVFEATLLLVDYEVLFGVVSDPDKAPTPQPVGIFDLSPFEQQLIATLIACCELKECNQKVQHALISAFLLHTTGQYPSLIQAIELATQMSFSDKVSLYLEARLNKELSLPMLAEHFQVSVTTVKRRLAEDGLSFTEMIKRKRIYKGATLLRAGRTSITEIASLCGFNSATHFSNAFKSIYGCTPKLFRRERRTP